MVAKICPSHGFLCKNYGNDTVSYQNVKKSPTGSLQQSGEARFFVQYWRGAFLFAPGFAVTDTTAASGPWPLLLAERPVGDPVEPPAIAPDFLTRLDDLIGPALARHLLYDSGLTLADSAVTQSRLLNRFRRADGLYWAQHAAAHGIKVICLKGLASAHLYYANVDLRTMSDADLLVAASDRDRLVALYRAAGLDFHKTEARGPWGHISDASMLPLTGADGASNVDLHIHPDAWPLHLGLSSRDVFAAARSIAAGDGRILVPSPTHMLLLTASHAARDLFGPSTAKSLIDAALLLRQEGGAVDWPEFEERLQAGRVGKPVRAFLAILDRLGADTGSVPRALKRAPAGAEFESAVRDYAMLFPDDASTLERARRELLLCAEPGVALRRNLLRLFGLIWPKRRRV